MSKRVLAAAVMGMVAGSVVGSAWAQGPVALLREGDEPTGFPITLGNVATNGVGGYSVGFLANSIHSIWGNAAGGAGAVLRSEGTFGPLVQTSLEGFYGISNAGSLAYSASGTGGPVGGFDSVWVDDTPVAVEGDPVPSIAGQNWVFGSRPTITTTGEPWWVGGYGPAASTTARALFRGLGATPVLKTGDLIGGLTGVETANAGAPAAFGFRVSALGTNWIVETQLATLAGVVTTANDIVIVRNGSALTADGSPVREGTVVPAASGGNGTETYQNFADMAINEAGDWILTGDTNFATTTQDAFIMKNGVIIHREGQVLDGLTLSGSFDWLDLNESGDWVVSWSINDGATREVLIFNGHIVLKETDPIDFDGDGVPETGVTLTDLTTGIDNMYMSERFGNGTVDIYFTADTSVPSPNEAFYRLTVQARCPGDFNNSGAVSVQDIFDFLAAYFGGLFGADFNRSGGVSVQDIFDFLAAYFGTCP